VNFFCGGGTRDYSDFASHSSIPDRGDGLRATARNAMRWSIQRSPAPARPFSILTESSPAFRRWSEPRSRAGISGGSRTIRARRLHMSQKSLTETAARTDWERSLAAAIGLCVGRGRSRVVSAAGGRQARRGARERRGDVSHDRLSMIAEIADENTPEKGGQPAVTAA